jgi:hypothetical protein
VASGNATADSSGTPFTSTLAGYRYLSNVEVSTSDNSQGTVAVLGDQLTAVAPAGGGFQPTWVDNLPAKLAGGGVPLPGGLVNASSAGLPATGWWKLDDGSGTTARDSAGSAPATATGAVGWSTEHGGSVTLTGTGSLATTGKVFGTTVGYTVSAWVKLGTAGAAAQTVASEDGPTDSVFALQYSGSATNKWAFTLADSSGTRTVLSTSAAATGTWTHVYATYNPASHTAELYVNGVFQGYVSVPSTIAATGPFTIGRGKAAGASSAFFTGAISDVRAYERAGNGWDAVILYRGGPGTGPQPGLGAPTATDADNYLDRTVLGQPRLRTVVVALGANDILAGRDAASIRRELSDLMATFPTSATGIANSRRPDNAPVHVILTTVPALGLADTDPREQVRRDLNADILTHHADYGADEAVDLAVAVADPAHPNQINPNDLTSGAPNAAYHDAIAQELADAATRFPPEAQL